MRILDVAIVCSALAVLGCGDDASGPDGGSAADGGARSDARVDGGGSSLPFRLEVLSGRVDMVTGGDALVLLEAEPGVDVAAMRVFLGDADVTDQFRAYDAENRRIARIEGLALGDNELAAELGDERATLVLRNHPIMGPVFSGPHETPYYCSTETYFLGAPLDEDCSAETIRAYLYRGTDGMFRVVADPTSSPSDIAQTTTIDGRTIDFKVQLELGTINRAIYWVSSLYDPEAPDWEPWAPSPLWNRKVVYIFGGGCGPGHVQGNPSLQLATSLPALLAQGFVILHSSLNTLANNCNDVLSAETAMMVKEHFIERYGVPIYTMGFGGSGGSIQQHLIADNYPGILDGILPSASFPDIWSISPDIVDCRLLLSYFDENAALWPDAEAKRAVTGYATLQTCEAWNASFADLIVASRGCSAEVPPEDVYHPTTNPSGIRCTIQDHNVNIFGVDPATGFARRPYDNVGVQYGLAALESGAITKEQFLDLNAEIGGFDIDGELARERTRADAEVIRIAYASGRILDGQGLGTIPIVDVRTYLDPSGDIHDAFRTLSTRERLMASNGDAENHVTFFLGADPAGRLQGLVDAFVLLDQWLVALAADDDPDRHAAVLRTRPAELDDRCYTSTSPTEGRCSDALPVHQSPRRVAGAPLANDVIQCALQPVDPADYSVSFTDAELERLRAIFPLGVCDYAAPPPNRVEHAGPWQRFGAGP